MPPFVAHHLVGGRGSRPHEAHLPPKDVPELGELVEARLAEEPADLRDAGVVLHLEHRPLHLVLGHELLLALFRVDVHGAELPAPEDPAVHPDAPLGKEERTGGVEADGEGDEGKEENREGKPDEGAGDVEAALEEELASIERLPVEGEHREPLVEHAHLPPHLVALVEVEHHPDRDPHLRHLPYPLVEPSELFRGNAEDHLVHRVEATDLRQVLHPAEHVVAGKSRRLCVAVRLEETDHPQPPAGVELDQLHEGEGLLAHADNEHVPHVVPPLPDEAEDPLEEGLFGAEEEEGEDEKGGDEPTAVAGRLEEVDDGSGNDPSHHVDLHEGGEYLREGPGAQRGIEAVAGDEVEPDRDDDDEEPRVVEETGEAAGGVTDHVGKGKRPEHHDEVGQHGQSVE